MVDKLKGLADINRLGRSVNLDGDAGNFESDPSRWGISIWGGLARRDLGRKDQGFASYRYTQIFGSQLFHRLCHGRAVLKAGKNYIAQADVWAEGLCPPETALSIVPRGMGAPIDKDKWLATTFGKAAGGWQRLYCRWRADGSADREVVFDLVPSDPGPGVYLGLGGQLWVDRFWVHEFEYKPKTPCKIRIDTAATRAEPPSAPGAADGSVTAAVSGAAGPVEYSINGGGWGPSPVFRGLSAGLYSLSARESDRAGCFASAPVAVPPPGCALRLFATVKAESHAGASDGSATLRAAGGSPPIGYSLDGGATFLPYALFDGLAAGRYQAVARDSAGCAATADVEVAAGGLAATEFYLHKNPLPVDVPNPAPPLRPYARVEAGPTPDNMATLLEADLPPGPGGRATANLRQAFEGMPTPDPPSPGQNFAAEAAGTALDFAVWTGTRLVSKPSPPRRVFWGGLSEWPEDGPGFFEWLEGKGGFMTWCPPVKTLDPFQDDWLNWLPFKDAPGATLRAELFFENGETVETTLQGPFDAFRGACWRLPSGPANSGALAAAAGRPLASYGLWVASAGGGRLTQTRRCVVARPGPLNRHVLFLNSLGAWETARLAGRAAKTTQAKRSAWARHGARGRVPAMGGHAELSEAMEYHTGPPPGDDPAGTAAWWRELLAAPAAYDITGGAWQPLGIDGGKAAERSPGGPGGGFKFTATVGAPANSWTPLKPRKP